MQDDFWTHDIRLFDGVFAFYRNMPRPVRGKIHTSEEPYRLGLSERVIRPVNTLSGTRTYVMLQPYVFEPVLTLTVGLYDKPKHYADQEAAIGKTLGGAKQEGIRDVQIGNAQAWYYHQDKTIELWECFLGGSFRMHPFVEDSNMHKLWQGFEQWLCQRFLQATRIITPCHDPVARSIEEYQAFLYALGYASETEAAFAKSIRSGGERDRGASVKREVSVYESKKTNRN